MPIFSQLLRNPQQAVRPIFVALAVTCAMSAFATRASAGSPEFPQGREARETVQTVAAPINAEDDIDPKQPIKTSFLINVSVLREPEPSGNYVVNPAGNILMHVAEVLTPVTVRGLTCTEASAKITDFLKTYMKEPSVTVSIVSVPQSYASVSGGVRLPGMVPIGKRTTLVEVLSKAEWSQNADLSQVRITRQIGEDKSSILVIDLNRYLQPDAGKTPDETQNPRLQDRDSILVTLKGRIGGSFSITGAVARPAVNIPVRLTPPMTLREAMAFAGGTTAQSNRKTITLLRLGQPQPIILDLDKAESGDAANNIEIHADDAIYVESLGAKSYVEVNGGFAKPGKVVFDKKLTLTEAVMQAGGFTAFAKEQEGMILRHADDDPKSTVFIPFKWKNIMARKSPDIALNPGDTIWVATKAPSGPAGASSLLQYLSPLSLLLRAGGF